MSDSEDDLTEKQLRIIVLGEPATGKTSLVSRYCYDHFSRQYCPTSGVDFFLKKVSLGSLKDISLQIWDIGGRVLSGNLLDKYVLGANIVYAVYDVTSMPSFEGLYSWLEAVRRICAAQKHQPLICILGNKCDLEHQRCVRLDRHNMFVQENNVSSYLVSARTGEMVALCFQKMVAHVLGIQLSRAEQEEQQPVMRAEIVAVPPVTPENSSTITRTSSVCVIQ
ncbi:ras-related protein Rab-28-like [Schistocerca piceifrons]|uniref:ras-related protein Rab-28-like n=1 Tax=Schistocerca piceifrons TaxID=274613 RepID=UPI001F5EA29C|nr:ras-related protein Rab-28-like [Schistocerca piceifrons]